MRIKENFTLKKICDENIIISDYNVDFSKVICISDSGAYLWNTLKDKEFTLKDACDAITNKYDVDHDTAMKDVSELFDKLSSVGIVEL